MSFLRALRAYVGLGPDEEIEDRYLYELNSRRRALDLDELDEDAEYEDADYEQADYEDDFGDAEVEQLDLRRLKVNPDGEREIDLRDFEHDETVQIKHRRQRPGETRRGQTAQADGGQRPREAQRQARGVEPGHETSVFDDDDGDFEDPALDGTFDGDELFGAEPLQRTSAERPDDGEVAEGLDRVTAEFLAKKSPFEVDDEPAVEAVDEFDDNNGVRTVGRESDGKRSMKRGNADPSANGKTGKPEGRGRSGKGRGASKPDQADDDGVVRSLASMRAKPRTLIPESFADAKLVADEFKREVPVLLNLQGLERDLARRLIDFASGICYALDGSMEKIASQVFLLIPDGGQVSDEDRRRIEERGYAR